MKIPNSPRTGKPMLLKSEIQQMPYRKMSFEVVYHFFECEDTQMRGTTSELDALNTEQVYQQYRAMHRLPFTNEIAEIRQKYGLPAITMSEILGFGANSYRNYENGEVPSEANGRLLQLIKNTQEFLKILDLSTIPDEEKERIKQKIEAKKAKQAAPFNIEFFTQKPPSSLNGYRSFSYSRAFAAIAFLAKELQPTKTKLNKLLFYTDFIFFKQHAISFTGLEYRAIQYGPVPQNYDVLYALAAQNNIVNIEVTEIYDKIGERFLAIPNTDLNVLDEIDTAHLQRIVTLFKDKTAKEISEDSHNETAWLKAHELRTIIDYKTAFELKYF